MSIKDALYKPFEDIPTRRGRGGSYQYVRWQDVANRMNEVFGVHWSSEVAFQDIVGKNIIVRVSVCVKDPDTGERFCQEGFGGALNDENQEAGNAFKSAYSKALKDACKRWGVGLFLDEDSESANTSEIPKGFTAKEYGIPNNAPPTSTTPNQASVGLPTPPDMGMQTFPGTPTMGLESKSFVINADQRAVPTAPVQEKPVQSLPTMPTPGMSIPGGMDMPKGISLGGNQAQSTPSFAQPKVAPITTPEEGSISDVQKVALNNILKQLKEQYNIAYEGLAEEAFKFCGINKSVPDPENLSYNEALQVIKYGNNKFRKN